MSIDCVANNSDFLFIPVYQRLFEMLYRWLDHVTAVSQLTDL